MRRKPPHGDGAGPDEGLVSLESFRERGPFKAPGEGGHPTVPPDYEVWDPEVERDPRGLSPQAREAIDRLAARYPWRQSAALPALFIAQNELGFITPRAVVEVAELLDMSPAEVQTLLTFYPMFRRRPAGRYVINVCTTISCQLCGGYEILEHLEKRLGIHAGETTPDGAFTLQTWECIAACGGAPAIQVNLEYIERVTIEQVDRLLDELRAKAAADLKAGLRGPAAPHGPTAASTLEWLGKTPEPAPLSSRPAGRAPAEVQGEGSAPAAGSAA
ncbi:MAG TPA: NAD(P)H-dependent oxidoreductase subunit E, partial [Thermodesulfobacteriota bacterium]|nr:NAD(P)H-dependent oxidoreductase subunit E [Thermodesulfobacteriota bacterium]